MATLPVISGREAVKAFEKIGFKVHRQRGSHIILTTQTGAICRSQTTRSWTGEP